MGYGGAAETVVLRILKKSTIPAFLFNMDLHKYSITEMYIVVAQPNFLTERTYLLLLEKLYRQYTGESLAFDFVNYKGAEVKIQYAVE